MKNTLKALPVKAASGMKKKTLIRIFLRFFALTLLLMISSLAIAAYSNYRMIDDVKEANRNYLRTVTSSLDSQFNKIKDKGFSLASDSSFLNLITMKDKYQPNYASSAFELSGKLYELYAGDDAVDDAFVYFKNINTVLAASGTYEPDYYFNRYSRYKDYTERYWNNQAESGSASQIFPATDVYRQHYLTGEKRYKTIIPLVLNIENIAHSRSYMIVNIDEQKIYQMIDNMNITKKGEIYIVDTLHDRLISATDRKMLGDTLDLAAYRLNAGKGMFESEISQGGDRYILSFQPSSWSNLGFLILTPEKVLTGSTNKFLILTVSVIAAFMLIGTIVSVVFTFGIYSPLAEMVNYVKRFAKRPFEGGTSEYEYIKENISSLHQFRQENLPSLTQVLLHRALNGQLQPEDIERLNENYDLYSGGSCFALAVVRDGLDSRDERTMAEFKRHLASLNLPMLGLSPNESILFIQARNADDIAAAAERIGGAIEQFQQSYGGTVVPGGAVVGLSPVFGHLLDIWRGYQEACVSLDMRGITGSGILFGESDRRPAGANVLLTSDKRETLRKYVENGHADGVDDMLKQLFDGVRKQNMPFKEFKLLASDLIYVTVEFVYSRGIDDMELFGMPTGELIALADSQQHAGLIEAHCLDVYRKATRYAQSRLQSSQAIDGMLDYINDHLAEANLTSIAERFDMNANYVSQYFKKHRGVTFTDYINHLRIEKAKELLVSTGSTANEIGQLVGFNNANAFIRMFKKLEGTTPNEFRKGGRAHAGGRTLEGGKVVAE